ncbi:MAG: hypothetical protein C4297_08905 [Gemmataceae bacterium]
MVPQQLHHEIHFAEIIIFPLDNLAAIRIHFEPLLHHIPSDRIVCPNHHKGLFVLQIARKNDALDILCFDTQTGFDIGCSEGAARAEKGSTQDAIEKIPTWNTDERLGIVGEHVGGIVFHALLALGDFFVELSDFVGCRRFDCFVIVPSGFFEHAPCGVATLERLVIKLVQCLLAFAFVLQGLHHMFACFGPLSRIVELGDPVGQRRLAGLCRCLALRTAAGRRSAGRGRRPGIEHDNENQPEEQYAYARTPYRQPNHTAAFFLLLLERSGICRLFALGLFASGLFLGALLIGRRLDNEALIAFRAVHFFANQITTGNSHCAATRRTDLFEFCFCCHRKVSPNRPRCSSRRLDIILS